MISIFEEKLGVTMHGKSFILEVLDFLRDPDYGDFFLSLPDNEFNLDYYLLRKKFIFRISVIGQSLRMTTCMLIYDG